MIFSLPLYSQILFFFFASVNSKNMSKFAKQFQKRTDIHLNLKDGLKCDALVVVGTKSHAHLHAAEYMHSHMDKVSTFIVLLKVYFFNINNKYSYFK